MNVTLHCVAMQILIEVYQICVRLETRSCTSMVLHVCLKVETRIMMNRVIGVFIDIWVDITDILC